MKLRSWRELLGLQPHIPDAAAMCCALIAAVGGLPAAHAADSPARLREDEASIESKLRVPEGLAPGRYDVHCEAHVSKSGKANYIACYGLESAVRKAPPELLAAVRTAGSRATFVPAIRDGKPAEVYMVLMVRVVIARDEPLVLVLPNNGAEHARYGLFYIAPQRFNEFDWGSSPNARKDTLVWQELWIDEHGKVTDSKLTNVSGAPVGVLNAVRASMENMRFMPGMVDGKPVPMRYIEPAFTGR